MQAEKLYGIWELISCYGEFENTDGKRVYPFGEDAIGQLTYHVEGYMSAFVSNPNRFKKSRDLTQLTEEEAKNLFVSFIAYAGRFTIDLKQSTVIHHVTIAHDPNWVGTDQVRYFTVDNNFLQIRSASAPYDGKSLIAYLDWRKSS